MKQQTSLRTCSLSFRKRSETSPQCEFDVGAAAPTPPPNIASPQSVTTLRSVSQSGIPVCLSLPMASRWSGGCAHPGSAALSALSDASDSKERYITVLFAMATCWLSASTVGLDSHALSTGLRGVVCSPWRSHPFSTFTFSAADDHSPSPPLITDSSQSHMTCRDAPPEKRL